MKISVFILLLFLSIQNINAITVLDSIQKEIYTHTDEKYFTDWTTKIIAYKFNNKDEKIKILNFLIERTEQLNYREPQMQLMYRKSLYYNYKGNFSLALEIIHQITPYFKRTNSLYLGSCYNSASDMLSKLGDTATAIQYIKMAIDVTKKDTSNLSTLLKINNYLVYGAILSRMDKPEAAHEQFLVADRILKQNPKLAESRAMCFNLLNLLGNQTENTHIVAVSNKIIAISKRKNYLFLQSLAYQKKASTYKNMLWLDSALIYIEKGINITKSNNFNKQYVDALTLKSQILYDQNKPNKAFLVLKKSVDAAINNDALNKNATSKFLLSNQKRKAEVNFKLLNEKETRKRERLNLIIFAMLGLILLGSIAIWQWNKGKTLREKVKKEILERRLIQSQMRMINSQMNPHFVFNALNSVQDLIMQKDIRASNIYLGKFAELMRLTLENSTKDVISIREEINILNLYLELESLRFNEDFKYTINCKLTEDEQDYETIPAMLLQPYVENSIKHGLLHKMSEKILTINFTKSKTNSLICEIIDNGVGREKSAEINERRLKNHKSFATLANQKRIDLINESSDIKTILTISDVKTNGKIDGTKVSFIFNK